MVFNVLYSYVPNHQHPYVHFQIGKMYRASQNERCDFDDMPWLIYDNLSFENHARIFDSFLKVDVYQNSTSDFRDI